jgi:hypothetical protein
MNPFEIKSRLKFISNVNVGDKINVKFMIIQKDSVYTKLSRTLYYENRQNTLIFLKDTIHRAFEIINMDPPQMSKEYNVDMMKIDLLHCKVGIENLKQTYLDDVKFRCDLDTVIQEIEQQLPKQLNTINHSDQSELEIKKMPTAILVVDPPPLTEKEAKEKSRK